MGQIWDRGAGTVVSAIIAKGLATGMNSQSVLVGLMVTLIAIVVL